VCETIKGEERKGIRLKAPAGRCQTAKIGEGLENEQSREGFRRTKRPSKKKVTPKAIWREHVKGRTKNALVKERERAKGNR